MTPLRFLFIFVFLCTRSFFEEIAYANSIFLLNVHVYMKLENNASE